MIDYYGLWQGFLAIFLIAPALVGIVMGAIYGWRNGRRGAGLLLRALFSGTALGFVVFMGAVLFFRA